MVKIIDDDDISITDKGHGKKKNQKLKPYCVVVLSCTRLVPKL